MTNDRTSVLCSGYSPPLCSCSPFGFSQSQLSWDHILAQQKGNFSNRLSAQPSSKLSTDNSTISWSSNHLSSADRRNRRLGSMPPVYKPAVSQGHSLPDLHRCQVMVTQNLPCKPACQRRMLSQDLKFWTSGTLACTCNRHMADGNFVKIPRKNTIGPKILKTLNKCSRSRSAKRIARMQVFGDEYVSEQQGTRSNPQSYLIAHDTVTKYVDTAAIQRQYLQHLNDQARSRRSDHVGTDSRRGRPSTVRAPLSADKLNQLNSEDPHNPWVPVFVRLNKKDKLLVYEAIVSLMNEQ